MSESGASTKCARCFSPGAKHRCSRCKTARYCSVKCQKQDWVAGKHSQICSSSDNALLSVSNLDTIQGNNNNRNIDPTSLVPPWIQIMSGDRFVDEYHHTVNLNMPRRNVDNRMEDAIHSFLQSEAEKRYPLDVIFTYGQSSGTFPASTLMSMSKLLVTMWNKTRVTTLPRVWALEELITLLSVRNLHYYVFLQNEYRDIVDVLVAPGSNPFQMLGNPEGRTLFLKVAPEKSDEADKQRYKLKLLSILSRISEFRYNFYQESLERIRSTSRRE